MRKSYEKGLANHSAPNPTLRTVTSWVLQGQGVHVGQLLSSEICNVSRADLLLVTGRQYVGQRIWRAVHGAAESENLSMRGNSRRENREIPLVSPRWGTVGEDLRSHVRHVREWEVRWPRSTCETGRTKPEHRQRSP